MTDILRDTPRGALTLALLGLAPFVVSAASVFLAPQHADIGARSLMVYAAVSVSFLGGTRWGLAIANAPDAPDARALTAAALPALLAWVAVLVALPPIDLIPLAFPIAAVALVGLWWWDTRAITAGRWPAWYRPLRALMSVTAVASIIAASAGLAMARWVSVGTEAM